MSKQIPTELNTKKLANRISRDLASGFLAAFSVAPIMLIVDKSVVESLAGKTTITKSVIKSVQKMFLKPNQFFINGSFAWILSVYGGTYMANNSIDTLCKVYNVNDLIPKLIGVTSVNMVLSILKDAYFAKKHTTKADSPPVVKSVPLRSYIIWFIRDVATIAFGFVVPTRLGDYLHRKRDIKNEKAQKISQFFCPIIFQLVGTPLHLAGNQIYIKPNDTAMEISKKVISEVPKSLPIRMVRMASAYGIGGVNNRSFRNSLVGKIEGENWDRNYRESFWSSKV